MPLLGVWLDGSLYFSTSERPRKGENLAHDPGCVVSVASGALPAVDLVPEGEARKVTDHTELKGVAAAHGSKYGWEVRVRNGAFDADQGALTAGPSPYAVYAVAPTRVIGLPGIAGTDETGASEQGWFSPTRWRFR